MKKRMGICFLAVFLVILMGTAGYCYYYYQKYVNLETVYPGVTIQGMDMSGLSKNQVRTRVEEYISSVSSESVTLQVEDKENTLSLSEAGIYCVNPEVADAAYDLGKTGNLFKRVREIREVSKNGHQYTLQFALGQEETKKSLKKAGKQFLAKKKDATITRKDGKFVIKDEVDGIAIDFKANAKKLMNVVASDKWDQKGFTFAMDYDLDPAAHTRKELSTVKDTLGKFTTSYSGSTSGRCANVENGASLINGTVLYPGDSFSVYKAVAPFDAEHGYELAGSYENGKTVQSFGGGICQVSTTLYDAVLRAELNVTERSPHSMTVHYVELSEDAAISGTDKDLKFENNLDYPIYIEGKTTGDSITFTIYGKEYRSKNRTIEFVSERTSTKSPTEETIKDNTLAKGKRVTQSEGRTGYTARLWKVIYKDGVEQKRVQINSSSYRSTPSVVRVGTKEEASSKKKGNSNKGSSKDKNNTDSSGSNSGDSSDEGSGESDNSDE